MIFIGGGLAIISVAVLILRLVLRDMLESLAIEVNRNDEGTLEVEATLAPAATLKRVLLLATLAILVAAAGGAVICYGIMR